MESNRWVAVVAVAATVAAVAAVASAGAVIVLPRGSGGGGGLVSTIAAAATPQSRTVTVEGVGTANVAPDQARITVGVGPTRPSVHDAINTAGAELGRVIDVLHGQGVQDADIQTNSLGVQQVTNGCCPPQVTGYTAFTDLTVVIHHLANVQNVIAAVTDAVGNDARLQGVSLFVGDPTASVKTARAAAMKDAGERAKQWSDASGTHVGKIVGVSEVVGAPPGPVCTQGCGGGGGIPVQAGTSVISVTVTVVYELS